MVQVMAEASHKKPKTIDWPKKLPPARLQQTAEHHLGHREGVPPVVVCHFLSVVLLHCYEPAAHFIMIQLELVNKPKIIEHP